MLSLQPQFPNCDNSHRHWLERHHFKSSISSYTGVASLSIKSVVFSLLSFKEVASDTFNSGKPSLL
jgi:hypothetical protein